VKPTDDAKLAALAKKFDNGNEHYTVQKIGGWSVVADSAENFQAVRAADSNALADSADFKAAMSQVGSAGFATVYASKTGVQQLPAKLQALVRVAGSPRWVAAGVDVTKDALHLDARTAGASTPAAYKPSLLRDVPSGAILAVSFKNVNQLLARIQAEPTLRASVPSYVTGLRTVRGEVVLYLAPGMLLRLSRSSCSRPIPRPPRSHSVLSLRKNAKSLPLHVERQGQEGLADQRGARFRSGNGDPSSTTAVQGRPRCGRCSGEGHMARIRRHPAARSDSAGARHR